MTGRFFVAQTSRRHAQRRQRHSTARAACAEAGRLALKSPGSAFVVCEEIATITHHEMLAAATPPGGVEQDRASNPRSPNARPVPNTGAR